MQLDEVNADSVKHMGRPHNDEKYRHVRLTHEFQNSLNKFPFKSKVAFQKEIVEVLEKSDEGINFEKFAPKNDNIVEAPMSHTTKCCVIL